MPSVGTFQQSQKPHKKAVFTSPLEVLGVSYSVAPDSHSRVPNGELHDAPPKRLPQCTCLHPMGSHFGEPTAVSLAALPRLHYCMCLHPTGSHFDVPTGESLAVL